MNALALTVYRRCTIWFSQVAEAMVRGPPPPAPPPPAPPPPAAPAGCCVVSTDT